jgi:hypothetical protein
VHIEWIAWKLSLFIENINFVLIHGVRGYR